MPDAKDALPSRLSAVLLLSDGTVFFGYGFGTTGKAFGEICFNTSMTGYQEVLTDPSYQGQLITFTFPHIGNVGCNKEDRESGFGIRESGCIGASGLIVREAPTSPSNFRATASFDDWLKTRGIVGICGIDTRALTRHIRMKGAQNAAIVSGHDSRRGIQGSGFANLIDDVRKQLAQWPSLEGTDLAKPISTNKIYEWQEPRFSSLESRLPNSRFHVVAIDYGIKLNILRCLASLGCKVTVVPADFSAETILQLKPDGVFLSNGPGDPAATGAYALPVIKKLIDSGLPIFGICLGHQLLGIAMGGKTEKMHQGHRGANHPVKELTTGKIEITSQNHGFVVSEELPLDVEVTHRSLFDGTIQGLRHKTKPIFCVQGHPEASPGPHDALYLFEKFVEMMENHAPSH